MMSQRAYAADRRSRGLSGSNPKSVRNAINAKRLVKSLVWVNGIAQIADPQLADQEWEANTDHGKRGRPAAWPVVLWQLVHLFGFQKQRAPNAFKGRAMKPVVLCSFPECSFPAHAKGLCAGHYATKKRDVRREARAAEIKRGMAAGAAASVFDPEMRGHAGPFAIGYKRGFVAANGRAAFERATRPDKNKSLGPCSVCGRPAKALSLCPKHLSQHYRSDPEKRDAERQRMRVTRKLERQMLSDSYVANKLRMRIRDCPPVLLEAKRVQLQISRLAKEATK